jgi:Transglutaminase-like superfamily
MSGDPRRLLRAARVIAFAALVPLITRLPLERQAALLEPRRPPALDPERAAWLEANMDRLIATAQPLVRPGCLTRGLTRYFFLRRAGVEVRLAYGIGEVDGRTEGHCWLVRDGEPYRERRDPREHFTETWSVPRA